MIDTERAPTPPLNARPKGAAPLQTDPPEPKRGPGRPPKGDPFTILRMISIELGTVDKTVRRQILETLLALSE